MSNFAGCRSANRGTCAQNCRYVYRDDSGQEHTALSMRDLDLGPKVADLIAAGVVSLKIEGRLKGPDYVWAASRACRLAVDAALAHRPYPARAAQRARRGIYSRPTTATPADGIYGSSARLLGPAHGDEEADAILLKLDRPGGRAEIQSQEALRAGLGFAFTIDGYEDGFLVTAARPLADCRWQCRIRCARRGPPPPGPIALRLNADHEQERACRVAMAAVPLAAVPAPTQRLDLTCCGRLGAPLRLHGRTATGEAVIESQLDLTEARSSGLDTERLRAGLGALGGTAYHLGRIDAAGLTELFLPASELKSMRRSLVAALEASNAEVSPRVAEGGDAAPDPAPRETRLIAAVAEVETVHAVLAAGADAVWLDNPAYDPTSDRPRRDLANLPAAVWYRHSPVLPTPSWLATLGRRVVAGHLGTLVAAASAGVPVVADQALGCMSAATATALAGLGASDVVVSLECSLREIARMIRRSPPVGLIVCVHGHLPAMLTRQEHGLAVGHRRRIQARAIEGGLPYHLEQRAGHTVVREARCLAAPAAVARSRGLVDGWLLELSDQDTASAVSATTAYRGLLDGDLDPDTVTRRVAAQAPDGCFPGHLETGSRALDQVSAGPTDRGPGAVSGCGS